MEIKKVVYAVDLEDEPHPAIEHVKMTVSLTGASLSIVYVIPSETVYESNYLSGESLPNRVSPQPAMQEKMNAFLAVHFPDQAVEQVFLMGKVSEEIVKYADNIDADFIVIGAHGKIGFNRLFFGSVATDVVKTAHCSVSVIRPKIK